jgi:hypothetical protein
MRNIRVLVAVLKHPLLRLARLHYAQNLASLMLGEWGMLWKMVHI